MLIDSIQPGTFQLAAPSLSADVARGQADFASLMGIAERGVSKDSPDPQDAAREAAEQFVAKVLIEPALAAARETSDLPPPLGRSRGEKQFASLIDAQRAMDLVRSSRWPIVDRLARDLTRRVGTGGANGVSADSLSIAPSKTPSDPPSADHLPRR